MFLILDIRPLKSVMRNICMIFSARRARPARSHPPGRPGPRFLADRVRAESGHAPLPCTTPIHTLKRSRTSAAASASVATALKARDRSAGAAPRPSIAVMCLSRSAANSASTIA